MFLGLEAGQPDTFFYCYRYFSHHRPEMSPHHYLTIVTFRNYIATVYKLLIHTCSLSLSFPLSPSSLCVSISVFLSLCPFSLHLDPHNNPPKDTWDFFQMRKLSLGEGKRLAALRAQWQSWALLIQMLAFSLCFTKSAFRDRIL